MRRAHDAEMAGLRAELADLLHKTAHNESTIREELRHPLEDAMLAPTTTDSEDATSAVHSRKRFLAAKFFSNSFIADLDAFDICDVFLLSVVAGELIIKIRFRNIENMFDKQSEEEMSEHMLHILAPSRYDSVAAIVGDNTALYQLRTAIDDAIKSGTGGVHLIQSDGEGYSLAIVRAADMNPVCTTYAGEVAPRRSLRETVSVRAMPNFLDALQKAKPPAWTSLDIPRLNSDKPIKQVPQHRGVRR